MSDDERGCLGIISATTTLEVSSGLNMGEVSERGLYVAVFVSFVAGVLVGWQANRQRRRYLDWKRKRLRDKLVETQKKFDLS